MDDKDFAEASTFKKNTTPFIALYKPLEIILTMSSYRLCTIKVWKIFSLHCANNVRFTF